MTQPAQRSSVAAAPEASKNAAEAAFAHFDASRYSHGALVGKGSCGLVFSGHDRELDLPIAIKKIALRDDTSAKRTLREIRFQTVFRHANVLGITDLCFAAEDRVLFCVMPKMDTDLGKVIRSSQALSALHVQFFTEQLLDGLAYLHECCNVMHRDLKPANLLVNESCELRISDFGLARLDPGPRPRSPTSPAAEVNGASDEGSLGDRLTTYVVTRWYRAPELVLSSKRYSKAVDLWSVGCIVAELLGRKPLFPGSSHVDQLERIIEQIGSPEPSALEIVPSGAKRYLAGLPRRPAKPLSGRFPGATPAALSFLEVLLVWDPSQRATVRQALNHSYLGAVSLRDDAVASEDPYAALEREVASFREERAAAKRGDSPPMATPTGASASAGFTAPEAQEMERCCDVDGCDAAGTCSCAPPAFPAQPQGTAARPGSSVDAPSIAEAAVALLSAEQEMDGQSACRPCSPRPSSPNLADYAAEARAEFAAADEREMERARGLEGAAEGRLSDRRSAAAEGRPAAGAAEAAKREATAFAKLLGERAEAEGRRSSRVTSRRAFESGYAVPTRA